MPEVKMQSGFQITGELWRSILINDSLLLSWEGIQGAFIFIWAQHIWSLHRISLMLHLLPACVQLLPTGIKLTFHTQVTWRSSRKPLLQISIFYISFVSTVIRKFNGVQKPQERGRPPSWEREYIFIYLFLYIKKGMEMLEVREKARAHQIFFILMLS